MVIHRQDRVSTVLRADESLIDVFVALSPAFERLRNPALRRVMSRLVTVEQAARMAGVDAEELVRLLNEHSAPRSPTPTPDGALGREGPATARAGSVVASGALPSSLAAIPAERIVDVDVRDDLRRGSEPFSRIMAARRDLPEGGALRVRAIFEPVPLYDVMGRFGLDHYAERLGDEDWRVWFHATAGAAAPVAGGAEPATMGATGSGASSPSLSPGGGPGGDPGAATRNDAESVVVLDVRGLEPPEPMVRTLEAVDSLPTGATLVQLNVRVPRFLLPLLEERGFTYEIREQQPDLVRVFIRRAGMEPPGTAEPQKARVSEMSHQPTLDVRAIPPREKHPTIFRAFESLAAGESFVLVNDHDPKPLHYQFEAERSGQFGWQYLEEGPTVWRVQISKVEP